MNDVEFLSEAFEQEPGKSAGDLFRQSAQQILTPATPPDMHAVRISPRPAPPADSC